MLDRKKQDRIRQFLPPSPPTCGTSIGGSLIVGLIIGATAGWAARVEQGPDSTSVLHILERTEAFSAWCSRVTPTKIRADVENRFDARISRMSDEDKLRASAFLLDRVTALGCGFPGIDGS